MVHRVLVIGHSFVHRLESFLFKERALGWYNMGFDGTEIQVEFASLSGGTLRPGPKCIQSRKFMEVFHSFQPHSVFIQIGGNDLTHEDQPERLARDIRSFAEFLITAYEINHIVVSQLLPRYSERSGPRYNDKVVEVNKHLSQLLLECDNVTLWKHRGLWKDTSSLLCDKVHLNDAGMRIYAKSVRAAVGSSKRR